MEQHLVVRMPSDVDLQRAWRIWDVDGDGELDFGELSRAVQLSFPELNDPEVVRRSFKAVDNGDGRVSRREFRLVLEYITYFRRLETQFAELDADSDGTLSLAEFVDACETLGIRTRSGRLLNANTASAHFSAMDTDGSGTIDFDEFAVWAVRNEVGHPPNTLRVADHSETPERERRSRAEAERIAQDQTQIYSPWKARAIAQWPREGGDVHPSDLRFNVGDIVSVTSKHCEKWWTGAAHGRHGTFPRKTVKLLPPGSRDAEVQAIEQEEARTRTATGSATASTAAAVTMHPRSAASSGIGHRSRHRQATGGARTPHARPPLTLPPSDELARIFLLWDPNGTGGDYPRSTIHCPHPRKPPLTI